jgi:hypothetical protein
MVLIGVIRDHSSLEVSNCHGVCVCVLMSVCVCVTACDDDCAGLLIRDMDRLHRIITSVNLTTPLPPPYKVLYRFENMTQELKVNRRHPNTSFSVHLRSKERVLQYSCIRQIYDI